jgi:hypothetical protein
MATKTQVAKFFQDNAPRISSAKDPVAYNTNAGLLALVNYLSSEFLQLNNRINELETLVKVRTSKK